MALVDLTLIWAGIIAVAIMMYVLMDGFDLGVGILFPFAPDDSSRDQMMNSVAPIWDGNETWLILGGAGLLGAFPLVYSVFLPALYIGVFLMLAGLIFRGIAFEFRFKSTSRRSWWNAAFFGGSLVAAFAQGAVVGTYIQGFEVADFIFVGGPFDWLTPFTVLTGVGLVVGYALLGATWTIMKTEGATQAWAYRCVMPLLITLMAIFAVISIWTPLASEFVRDRWFGGFSLIWLLPLFTGACALLLFRAIRLRREYQPFLAALGIFGFTYLGLLASKWPYIVPPDHTLWDAASAPESQLFLLVGMLFLIPVILAYTVWNYWVFRGKVDPEGGYH